MTSVYEKSGVTVQVRDLTSAEKRALRATADRLRNHNGKRIPAWALNGADSRAGKTTKSG